MQAKALLFSILFIFTINFNFAQTSASANNIAIQGIAREAGGNAKTGVNIKLTFEIYYRKNNIPITPPVYKSAEVNLTTDAFGVFSHIINPGVINNSKIANYQMYLKITEGTGAAAVLISDEKLNHVPYAIAANNGVPTGSIMPFVGETAPEGWLLCDGLTAVPQPSALYDLIGDTTPDLQGMFLRGTGINPVNNQPGPALKGIQADGIKEHVHDIDINTDIAPNHTHNLRYASGLASTGGAATDYEFIKTAVANSNRNTQPAGEHYHNVNGNTGFGPDVIEETRPVNYGVNYIIKL